MVRYGRGDRCSAGVIGALESRAGGVKGLNYRSSRMFKVHVFEFSLCREADTDFEDDAIVAREIRGEESPKVPGLTFTVSTRENSA